MGLRAAELRCNRRGIKPCVLIDDRSGSEAKDMENAHGDPAAPARKSQQLTDDFALPPHVVDDMIVAIKTMERLDFSASRSRNVAS